MTERDKTLNEVKQILTNFYYGKIKEEKDDSGNIVSQKTEIPSLRRKLKKAITHETVIETADKWYRDFIQYLNSI